MGIALKFAEIGFLISGIGTAGLALLILRTTRRDRVVSWIGVFAGSGLVVFAMRWILRDFF